MVILPGIDNTRPPAVSGGTYRARTADWPSFPQRGQDAVHGACGAGLLFHRDLCAKEARAMIASGTARQ